MEGSCAFLSVSEMTGSWLSTSALVGGRGFASCDESSIFGDFIALAHLIWTNTIHARAVRCRLESWWLISRSDSFLRPLSVIPANL